MSVNPYIRYTDFSNILHTYRSTTQQGAFHSGGRSALALGPGNNGAVDEPGSGHSKRRQVKKESSRLEL